MTEVLAAEKPVVRRWQDGYEIPLGAVEETVTDPESGEKYTQWRYTRLVVPAITGVDITDAVNRDHGGDQDVLTEALEHAPDHEIETLRAQIDADNQATEAAVKSASTLSQLKSALTAKTDKSASTGRTTGTVSTRG